MVGEIEDRLRVAWKPLAKLDPAVGLDDAEKDLAARLAAKVAQIMSVEIHGVEGATHHGIRLAVDGLLQRVEVGQTDGT